MLEVEPDELDLSTVKCVSAECVLEKFLSGVFKFQNLNLDLFI